MKDETRCDHRTIVLLQTKWLSGRALADVLCTPYRKSVSDAIFGELAPASTDAPPTTSGSHPSCVKTIYFCFVGVTSAVSGRELLWTQLGMSICSYLSSLEGAAA